MTVDTRLMTADELLRLPDDGSRYELVEGELKKMSPSGADHSEIALLIGSSLVKHVRKNGLGTVYGADGGFLLQQDPDTVRAPDVGFVAAARSMRTSKFFPGAPDLAIEVMSPSDLASEVSFKTSQYLRAGTRAVVVVDPDKRIVYVHRAAGNDVHTTIVEDVLEVEDVVSGWKMPLGEIFDA